MSAYFVVLVVYLLVAALSYRSIRGHLWVSLPQGYPVRRQIKRIVLSELLLLLLCVGVAAVGLIYEWPPLADPFDQVRYLIGYVFLCAFVRGFGYLALMGYICGGTPSPADWYRKQQRI